MLYKSSTVQMSPIYFELRRLMRRCGGRRSLRRGLGRFRLGGDIPPHWPAATPSPSVGAKPAPLFRPSAPRCDGMEWNPLRQCVMRDACCVYARSASQWPHTVTAPLVLTPPPPPPPPPSATSEAHCFLNSFPTPIDAVRWGAWTKPTDI